MTGPLETKLSREGKTKFVPMKMIMPSFEWNCSGKCGPKAKET